MFGRVIALVLAAALMAAPAARAAPQAEPTFTPAQVRSDFTALYAGLKQAVYDINAKTPAAELDRAFAAEMAAIDRPMTRFEVQVAFQRFVARVKIAHARIDFPREAWDAFRKSGGRAFPLYVRVVDGHVYVAENDSGLAEISPGDELLALDGMPISQAMARAARNVSADTPYLANSLLEFDLPQMLWLEFGARDSFAVTVRTSGGKSLSLRVPARTRAEVEAAEAARPPSFPADADKREAHMAPGGVAYLRPGPFYNPEPGGDMWDPTAFKAFIDQAFTSFIDAGAKAVLIDLRENPGGDNSFSDPMIAWFADKPFRFFSHFKVKASPQAIASNQARLDAATGASDTGSRQLADLYAKARVGGVGDFDLPWAQPREGRRFTGKVYVLVNRHSFSNTVNAAALIQDNHFGVILGEETSDMATTFGAMEQFTLPVTGIKVGFPKAHIIRPNGDLVPRGVVPDVAIVTPVVPAKTDVVLERALEIARAGMR